VKQNDIDAIHHAIAKYDRLAHGFFEWIGAASCKLCQMYGSNDCVRCPIFKKTRIAYCHGTPWDDIFFSKKGFSPWCEAVEEEIEFLISLLPEKEQRRYDLEEI
jgi:hypothetical protein